MTNLEWLRTLSSEELVDIVVAWSHCHTCAYRNKSCPLDEKRNYDCARGFLEWTKQKHTENGK